MMDYEVWADDRVDEHERLWADNRVDESVDNGRVAKGTDGDEVHDGLVDEDVDHNDELAKSSGKRGGPAKQPLVESQSTSRSTTTAAQTTTRSTTFAVERRGGATGGGQAASFQVPRATSGSAQHIAKERNFARRGVGVFIEEGSGNIYYHPPDPRKVHTIHHIARV
ncbi:hypothetical protein OROGR_000027 [Orobanche gracilis]